MSTTRSHERREAARIKRLEASRYKSHAVKPPAVELNTDQLALRRILEHDFHGNRRQMALAMGLTSRALARYVQTGESTPKYPILEKAAEIVFSTVDAIRAEVLGDLYVDGEWYSRDDPEFEQKALEVIASVARRRLKSVGKDQTEELSPGD